MGLYLFQLITLFNYEVPKYLNLIVLNVTRFLKNISRELKNTNQLDAT